MLAEDDRILKICYLLLKPAVLVGVYNSLLADDQNQVDVKNFYAAVMNIALFMQIDIKLSGFYWPV
jgi:hypothetical protein